MGITPHPRAVVPGRFLVERDHGRIQPIYSSGHLHAHGRSTQRRSPGSKLSAASASRSLWLFLLSRCKVPRFTLLRTKRSSEHDVLPRWVLAVSRVTFERRATTTA